ncbi:MAG: HD domain-containing protein [Magnetococcales bacterium]|nr:HD domain-containing protein [Magnetococcales bacterium]
MKFTPTIDVFDLVASISNAVDLVDRKLVNHHIRVTYIASCLSEAGYLSRQQESTVIIAGMLHDIGALTREERLEFLGFDVDNPHRHSEVGYQLLKEFELFEDAAEAIRYHHVRWCHGAGESFYGKSVPLISHVLHLADRIDILIDDRREIYSQRSEIVERIRENTPWMFCPRVVDWFEKLARREEFWLDLTSPNLSVILKRRVKRFEIDLTIDVITSYAHLMSQLVDFRSRFTSTHSRGVSAVAEYVARLVGFSERECQRMMVAGFLHDIGKLAIPNDILEKPGKLSSEEYEIIKSHSYHTARILEPIRGIEDLVEWCSLHHEKANGTGYPIGEVGANIPLAASILILADIFTALTEDRPYRPGLKRERVESIIHTMSDNGELNWRIVTVLFDNYDEVNDFRQRSQNYADDDFRAFMEKIQISHARADREEVRLKLTALHMEKWTLEADLTRTNLDGEVAGVPEESLEELDRINQEIDRLRAQELEYCEQAEAFLHIGEELADWGE